MWTGIVLKLISAFVFTMMSAMVRAVSQEVPIGQIVFARNFFALVPVLFWFAINRELTRALLPTSYTNHIKRSVLGVASMCFGFSALAYLPLPDATIIGYASPLLAVVFAVIVLSERVRFYRWTAVFIGLIGVGIILGPKLAGGALLAVFQGGGEGAATGLGAILSLCGAICGAGAAIQIRRLVQTEHTATIVIFFSLFSSLLGLATLPFGWIMPSPRVALLLVGIGVAGGIGQVLMTRAYWHADASLIAPFEYTTILWAVALGWILFGDVPTSSVVLGGSIVISSGLYVALREHRMGINRLKARSVTPPPST